MKNLLVFSILIILTCLIFPNQIKADTKLEFYLDEFYSKSNEANELLRNIEIILKNGSRVEVCSMQKKAAKLGISANKSLIKAFEINGSNPPVEAIKASTKKWELILNKCL